MPTNLTRVVQLLAKLRVTKAQESHHDQVLTALTAEDERTYLSRIKDLLTVYEAEDLNAEYHEEEYWATVFEAFVVGHFENAHIILSKVADELYIRRFTKSNNIYPSVMVGLLKAVLWCEEKSAVKNESFSDKLPGKLGSMLLDYAGSAGGGKFIPSPWLLGQFSTAFSSYLWPKFTDEYWRRRKELLKTLREVGIIERSAEKIFIEVTGRLMQTLTLAEQVLTLADALDKKGAEYLT